MEKRTQALMGSEPGTWVALSEDETRVVRRGATFEEAASAAEAGGEPDPVLVLIPENWAPIAL